MFCISDPDIVKHGIPHLIYYGDFAGYKVLVMTKTGLALHNLRVQTPTAKFSIKTICKIAIQAVSISPFDTVKFATSNRLLS